MPKVTAPFHVVLVDGRDLGTPQVDVQDQVDYFHGLMVEGRPFCKVLIGGKVAGEVFLAHYSRQTRTFTGVGETLVHEFRTMERLYEGACLFSV